MEMKMKNIYKINPNQVFWKDIQKKMIFTCIATDIQCIIFFLNGGLI